MIATLLVAASALVVSICFAAALEPWWAPGVSSEAVGPRLNTLISEHQANSGRRLPTGCLSTRCLRT
jgi:hypothetical protein